MADKGPLVKEIYIDASQELVFEFFTQADKMVRWWGLSAKLDPVPGGVFRLDPNGRDVIQGRFVEVEPYRRIVFTWGWDAPDARVPAGSTIVEVELLKKAGGTLVRVTHRGLPEEARPNHELGWKHYLSRVKLVAEGGDPGYDPFSTPDTHHG